MKGPITTEMILSRIRARFDELEARARQRHEARISDLQRLIKAIQQPLPGAAKAPVYRYRWSDQTPVNFHQAMHAA